MHGSPLILLIAALFAGMTAMLTIGSVVVGSPVAFLVAIPLGATAYFMYYHGSGKLVDRLYRREARRRSRRNRRASGQRGGFGAGPRARRDPRTRAEREARFGRRGADGFRGAATEGAAGQYRRDVTDRVSSADGPTRAEALAVLGVDSAADQSAIKTAYRERVKTVHPDRGGDEAEFRRVTAAYDRLRE